MTKRRFWGSVVLAIPMLVWGYDRICTVYWVGSTDLEIEFRVTDQVTGKPVKGATVAVISAEGFYAERDEEAFCLITDDQGLARRVCHDNMCSGASSALGFTEYSNTVPLPWWQYYAFAAEYEMGEVVELRVPENTRRIIRTGRDTKLTVNIPLRKIE